MRYLLVLMLLVSTHVSARMVLVTSFRKTKEQSKVERLFRKKINLRAGEQLQVIHKADQWALYSVLRDPTVTALFWISHGVSGRSNQTVDGATLLPKLLDHRGDNVAPIFNLMGDSIKFVAIVGCNSAAILNHYEVDVTGIAHYIPVKRKVAVHLQVPRAVSAYRRANLSAPRPAREIPAIQGHILVNRQVSENPDVRSLRVYAGKKLVGLLPATSGNATFAVPAGEALKVKIESGQDPTKKQGDFGTLEVMSPDLEGTWSLFQNAQGVPFGVNHRLFLHKRL